METLKNDVQITISARLTKRTHKQWFAYYQYWFIFCEHYNLPVNIITEETLLYFCAWKVRLSDNGASSLRGYIYGIREFAQKIGQKTIVTQVAMPSLHNFFKARKKIKPPSAKDIIDAPHLKSWLTDLYPTISDDPSLDKTTAFNNQVWRSFWTFQFCTEGRNDRLVRKDINGVRLNMIEWNKKWKPNKKFNFLVLHYNKSKGNQLKQKQFALALCTCNRAILPICTVCETNHLLNWLTNRLKPKLVIWSILKNNKFLPITYDMSRNQIQKMEKYYDIPRGTYGTHTLRGGGDQYNRELGFTDFTRCNLAGWANLNTALLYATKVNAKQLIRIAQAEIR